MASSASSTDPSAGSPAEARALLFRVGDQLFGCGVEFVREILRGAGRHVTRIPGAPPYVRGLTNMRGDVLTVLDVGMRLWPESRPVEGAGGGGGGGGSSSSRWASGVPDSRWTRCSKCARRTKSRLKPGGQRRRKRGRRIWCVRWDIWMGESSYCWTFQRS
ncbi:MAG: chemotaxis protein CheW [Gemmatimonadaceae bacterium]